MVGHLTQRRMIPLHNSTIAMLKEWKLNYWKPRRTVLNNWSYNGFKIAFAKLKNHHKLKVNIHGLRATAALTMVDDGVAESVIQLILGHKELRTTQIYIGRTEEQLMKAMQAVWEAKANKQKAAKLENPVELLNEIKRLMALAS